MVEKEEWRVKLNSMIFMHSRNADYRASLVFSQTLYSINQRGKESTDLLLSIKLNIFQLLSRYI